jgi:H+-transporting ATPase
VLNDVVTISLATDRVQGASAPQHWDVKQIAKVGAVLAAGWLAVALALLWVALKVLELPTLQIQTLVFFYLMISAQATVYISRVPGRFWSLAPSPFVAATTLGNAVLASVLAASGILMTAVPLSLLALTGLAVLITMVALDQIKLSLFGKSGLLGDLRQAESGGPATLARP